MITMLYSLGHVVGADVALLGFLVCTLVYFGVCFLLPQNRKGGKKRVLLGWGISEALFDAALCCFYYPNGSYVNHGLGGATACLLWPVLLLFAGLLVSALHGEKE